MRSSGANSWSSFEDSLRPIIVEVLGVEAELVTLSASLSQDLDAKAVEVAELTAACADHVGVNISEDLLDNVRTVGDLFNALVQSMSSEQLSAIDRSALIFRLGTDGRLDVGIRTTDGSWTYADDLRKLRSGLYVVSSFTFGHVLKDLTDLVNDLTTSESELQRFFEAYPELLQGDEYDRVICQASISRADVTQRPWRADFFLTPIDQSTFCRILELKLPQMSVGPQKSGRSHNHYYRDLHRAIGQLGDYGTAFESPETRKRFREAYGVEAFRPELHLVAGRRWELESAPALLELQYRRAYASTVGTHSSPG